MNIDISTLTLDQKASLLSGHDFWSTTAIEDAGIPSLVLTDGPHGIRRQAGDADHLGINDALPSTCFPPAVAVGSSWDPEIAAQVGAAVGREALALGVAVVLGPGVNIKRSPLCGRNFEYYSEDPLLSGVLGAAHVKAMQDVGPGASVKHFAANNQEHERMRISADVDERTLREIYLPAFERVVTEAAPATVMCSYNKINGVYASHDRWLLTDVLRDEWGYQGAVVSDWGAVSDRVAGVEAGMDLEMPGSGGGTDQQIIDAVHSGELDESLVDASVARVLALTDLPHTAIGDIDVDAHHALARTLAADSVVLLKNDGDVLPLAGPSRLAVIGSFATTPRFQGGGSSHINPTRTDAALHSIRDLALERGVTVEHADGFLLTEDPDAEARRSLAVDVAGRCDTAIVFVGLGDREESEGFDRDTLSLPEPQLAVIRAVAEVAPRTVVVLSNGGVVSLEGWHDDVDAILEGWLLGQAGGSALADILFGIVNPSGHLAETIPLRLQDNPSWNNFPGEQGHVRYGEGVMVGYRHYETAGTPVRYPFGHGLSYTSFAASDLQVTATGTDTASVRLTVTNTGGIFGKHVVQLYVATVAGPVRRPSRELRAFTKIALEPGESQTVQFTLERRAFAYWDIELSQWVVPAGDYTVQIGDSVASISTEATIALTGDVLLRPLTMDSTVGDWFGHPIVGPALMEGLSAGMSEEQRQHAQENPNDLKMVESMPMQQFLAFTGGAFPQDALEQLMALSAVEPAAA
ncbi:MULTISPECIES: glycoside hydrolase family 3 C-terminal domain-containing protein [unclassified Rathayibacter]|uniref:glycoside hydrolase family 3 protein n=1 Tax=unclassified Rathayibacter TaxID=2609250 RepID=UPI001FB38F16|nr:MULTISPECIES: glycoside hydrolase family 3 C-terminal domain-containing protein [unclassified Rathayibacter]MCJ1674488.1 glycoside hydrolase family 3 C-terminal domain-containing protein [Rathayibacter sp. VKM Ac-2929]MCJ1684769.1 glycoside hydrolase family 3 C-terminal domain-containing protein [Rathayibacter sp. VKM Ac-2928]